VSLRPLDDPLAWVKGDRLLCDDVTEYGLRRIVVAQKSRPPDVDQFFQSALDRAQGAQVSGWLVEIGEFWFLWLVWKPAEGDRTK